MKEALVISLIILISFAVYSGYGIRLNQTLSLAPRLYLAKPIGSLYLNQIVTFHLPQSSATFAKIVAGLPGDFIEVRHQRLYINGVERGTLSSDGPIQDKIIPEGFFFALGTHPDSFDSRYEEFGLVPQIFVQEELWPIF